MDIFSAQTSWFSFCSLLPGYKKTVSDAHENGDMGASGESPLDDSTAQAADLHSLHHKKAY